MEHFPHQPTVKKAIKHSLIISSAIHRDEAHFNYHHSHGTLSFRGGGQVIVSYNTTFDYGTISTYTVGCADFLRQKGYEYWTFGSLPSYPDIAAAKVIEGPGSSPMCGTCWQLSSEKAARPIYVLAIDHAYFYNDFQLSLDTINALTNGHGLDNSTFIAPTSLVPGG